MSLIVDLDREEKGADRTPLRVVYDIPNKRDAAHLTDGIDPNVQDVTIVSRRSQRIG